MEVPFGLNGLSGGRLWLLEDYGEMGRGGRRNAVRRSGVEGRGGGGVE